MIDNSLNPSAGYTLQPVGLLYDLMPNMPEERQRPLVERLSQMLLERRSFKEAFCVV